MEIKDKAGVIDSKISSIIMLPATISRIPKEKEIQEAGNKEAINNTFSSNNNCPNNIKIM
jgi:predicted RND superfamily exporter protein